MVTPTASGRSSSSTWRAAPAEALGRLIHPVRPLILLPPVRGGRVVRINAELKAGVSLPAGWRY